MKAFDIEKLQSLTLSGEKMTKEIFDALFINPAPYYSHHQNNNGYYSPYSSFNSSFEQCEPTTIPYQTDQPSTNVSIKTYEIFKGAFDSAVNSGKCLNTEIPNDYSYYYQGQNYY
jgi:hypothetical protein